MDAEELTDTLRETLAQFDQSGEPRTTPEVADDLALGRRSTYNRLERLVEHRRIRTKKVGANARIWWRPRSTVPEVPDWPGEADSIEADVFDDVEVGMFVLDANFDVAWINAATERYFGLDRERVLGRDKRELIDESIAVVVENAREFTETVFATYDDNTYVERFDCQVSRGENGEYRWLEHRSKPIESGQFAGGRVELYYDITDRKRTERAHREHREQFHSLVDAVEEYAIFTLDTDGNVQTWNHGAEQVNGYETGEILGEHVSTFYSAADCDAGVPEKNLAAAADYGSIQDEGWRVRANGSRYWASVTITAIREEDGTLQGYAKIVRDMTDRRERERRLRRERDLNDRLLETAPIRLAVFRGDGSIERINSRTRRALGIDDSAVSDFEIKDFEIYDADGEPIPAAEHLVPHVIETGEPVSDWLIQHDGPDGGRRWVFLNVTPLFDDNGDIERVVVAGRDVTDLKRTERRLERQRDELESELDEVFERISDGFYALDENFRFRYLNDHAAAILGQDESVIGSDFFTAVTTTAAFERALYEARDTQKPVIFEDYYDPIDRWFYNAIYPSDTGLSVYFREITEEKEREQELERSRELLRHTERLAGTGGWETDLATGEQRWTRGLFEIHDFDVDETDENAVPTADEYLSFVAPEHRDSFRRAVDRCMDQGESYDEKIRIITRTGRERWIRTIGAPVVEDDEVVALRGAARDITERRERERQLSTLIDNVPGMVYRCRNEQGWPVEFVSEDCKELSGYDRNELESGAIEWGEDVVVGENRDKLWEAVQREIGDGSVFSETYRIETATGEHRWVKDHGRGIPDDTGNIVTIEGIVQDVSEQIERERKLERQREQLAALNSLNEVIRDITAAVIDQSTREQIEATVCDRIAASDSYLFAWIGEADPTCKTVKLRTEAGVEGYLDEMTISIDPEDPRSEGPTGRALRTGETQVTHDIQTDSRYDPWRDHIEEYRFRSSAACPIAHEGAVYGVLNVYAERPSAFSNQERTVISQLGEVVGHAIAAAERKQALQSDELVELDFQIRDVFATIDASIETSGTITFDHVVPADDGTFLVYGTATQDAFATVQGLIDVHPHWESVTVVSDDEPISFELRMVDPPVLSAVASRGGYVDAASIEDGDYHLTIRLAPCVDVRQITDTVEAVHPQAELLRRHQITQLRGQTRQLQRRLTADLTDRQRSTLEAAYHAGYFKWPRDTTGEQIATSIGIAPSTFHHHLRKAQQRTFDALLSAPIASTATALAETDQ